MVQPRTALALASVAWLGCATARPGPVERLVALEASGALGSARQAVVVSPEPSGTSPVAWALQREATGWRAVRGPMAAAVGRGGFARLGEKREGDGRTPSGSFRLERAFGYAPDTATRLNYRQATAEDLWIDDVASDQYNTWVRGPTSATSFERMRRDDALYELGIVVEYNTRPVVKGLGSAIFVHVWRGPTLPTAGCVAFAREDVAALLGWLDPEAQPVIVLGSDPAPGGQRPPTAAAAP